MGFNDALDTMKHRPANKFDYENAVGIIQTGARVATVPGLGLNAEYIACSNTRYTRQSKRRGEVAEWWRKENQRRCYPSLGRAADREDQRFIESRLATDFAAVEENGRDSLLFRLLILRDNEVQLPRFSNSRVAKKKGRIC